MFITGGGKLEKYFEGWYYKIVTKDQNNAFAIIPGIAMDEDGNKQSFIQVLDGKKHEAIYHKFDADIFMPTPRKHHLYYRIIIFLHTIKFLLIYQT